MLRYVKLCIYGLMLVLSGGSAGATTRTITDQQWHELAKDRAFYYRDSLEHYNTPEPPKESALTKAITDFLEVFNKETVQLLFWGLIAVVAIYIIYKLFLANDQVFFGRRKKDIGTGATENSADIAADNWEALLQRAVSNNDLPQAVRYSYMWLLQMLQEAQLIHYREDKTNFDYYKELRETAYKQSFRQLSRQYEYVIYGNYALSSAAYNQYIDLFNQVKRQLGK
jgi:hypothetical protein